MGILERRGRTCTVDEVLEIWYRIEVDDLMLGMVDRVRAAGVVTALATNQQSYRGAYMKANLGLRPALRPPVPLLRGGPRQARPGVLRAHHRRPRDRAGEAVFVDDVLANVRGARAVGLNAVHFAHTDTYGSLRCQLKALGVPGIQPGSLNEPPSRDLEGTKAGSVTKGRRRHPDR